MEFRNPGQPGLRFLALRRPGPTGRTIARIRLCSPSSPIVQVCCGHQLTSRSVSASMLISTELIVLS